MKPLGDFWRFREDDDVTIVCSELPSDLRSQMPFSDSFSPHYVHLYAYADLDALIEFFGHIRAVKPLNRVNIRLARELREDDYTSHLVLLGGVDWNQATQDILSLLGQPVALRPAPDQPEDACFEVREGDEVRQYRPTICGRGTRRSFAKTSRASTRASIR